jgi:hypothetical protein
MTLHEAEPGTMASAMEYYTLSSMRTDDEITVVLQVRAGVKVVVEHVRCDKSMLSGRGFCDDESCWKIHGVPSERGL